MYHFRIFLFLTLADNVYVLPIRRNMQLKLYVCHQMEGITVCVAVRQTY